MLKWASAAVVMVVAVIGCIDSVREKSAVEWVIVEEHCIFVTSEIFNAAKPIAVKYTDSWQTEEYRLFKAGGRQMEMIYAKANRAFTVALDYQMPIKGMVSTWNLNSKKNLVWGPLERIDDRFGTWFFRTYENIDLQRSCVGFMIEWDQIYEDPQGRPSKVFFGYYCAAERNPVEVEAFFPLIRAIRIGISEGLPRRKYRDQDNSEDKDTHLFAGDCMQNLPAVDFARGYGPYSDTGNPRFPFMFARYYRVSGGGKRY